MLTCFETRIPHAHMPSNHLDFVRHISGTPDFWGSVLWKRLMGTEVYSVVSQALFTAADSL